MQIEFIVACEHAQIAQGKLTASGILKRIHIPFSKIPEGQSVRIALWLAGQVLANKQDEGQEYRLVTTVVGHRELIRSEVPLIVPGDLKLGGIVTEVACPFMMNLNGLLIKEPGIYEFSVAIKKNGDETEITNFIYSIIVTGV